MSALKRGMAHPLFDPTVGAAVERQRQADAVEKETFSNDELELFVAEFRAPFAGKTRYLVYHAPNGDTAKYVARQHTQGDLLVNVNRMISLVGDETKYLDLLFFK